MQLAGSAPITDALLGDLAAGTDPGTAVEGLGAGAFRAPGVPGAAMMESDIGLNRVPRAYVSSKDAVGGSADGKNEGGNPYYTHRRGSSSGTDDWGHPTPYEDQ